MTENENMNTAQGLVDKSKSEAENDSLNRRNFLKKSALLSAPVIISIASKPVWAGNCSLSGMLSGNLSQQQYVCQGGTPGFWGTHPNTWPSPYSPGVSPDIKPKGATGSKAVYTGGTLFYEAFSKLPRPIEIYVGISMMNIIQMSGTDDRYQLGAHAVSALLNAIYYQNKYGTTEIFGYGPTQIQAMWNDASIGDQDLKVMFATLNERSPNPLG